MKTFYLEVEIEADDSWNLDMLLQHLVQMPKHEFGNNELGWFDATVNRAAVRPF